MTDARAASGRLALHPLVYLEDGDEVTIGRRDTDSYGIFPPDGAELVRRLAAGESPADAARWYELRYGETVDIDDLLGALDELGFIRDAGDSGDAGDPAVPAAHAASAASAAPVRWQRLGSALFSRPAFACYALVVGWAVVQSASHPDLLPSYRNVFFTDYFTVIQVTLFAAAVPLLLLHESFHALAGRRLGLRSSLRIGHRLYFIVLETSLDGLVAVERRKRYLPILAGLLADLVAMAVLTVAADLTRRGDGTLSLGGRFCLAVAFATLLRVLWQFYFYLRTDLYVLVTTALGCVDLHTTAKRLLRNRVNRALGRGERLFDESAWHPVDRRVAAWYSWLIVVGYALSIGTFVLALAPMAYQFVTGVLERFTGGGAASGHSQLDAAVFTGLTVLPLVIIAGMAIRDRRRRRESQLRHVVG